MHNDTQQPQTVPSPSSKLAREFQPLQEPLLSNPYPFFARARKEEPVFFAPRNMAVLTTYEDVQTVLKDCQRFPLPLPQAEALNNRYAPDVAETIRSCALATSPGFVFSDPAEHPRLRRALNRVLTPRRIAGFESAVRSVAHRLIDQLHQRREIDFIADFAHHYPPLVVGQLLAIPQADMSQFKAWIEDWINLLFMRVPPEEHLRCAQSLQALHQYLSNFLAACRQTSQDSLATDLLQALENDGSRHPILDAIELLTVLFVAGFEITENFLGLCLFHALAQPEYWQTLQRNTELIGPFIEEMLRFDSSGVALIRETAQETELHGVLLPAHTKLYLSLGSANHDEACFANPEVFSPEREHMNRHIAFGYGPHYCSGAPVARLETRVALELLSQRLEGLRMKPEQQFLFKHHSVSLRGLTQLFVEWDLTH